MVATQNPIEYEGTYPLPEAQLDRFLSSSSSVPGGGRRAAILDLPRRGVAPATLAEVQPCRARPSAGCAKGDATAVAEGRRLLLARAPDRALPSIELGASPRAAVHLMAAPKAAAWLDGRDFVIPDDVPRSRPRCCATGSCCARGRARAPPADTRSRPCSAVPVPR